MWKEFVKHPCWQTIEKVLASKEEALLKELEQAAWQGDTVRAARLAGSLNILRWVRNLPQTLDEQQKTSYNRE